MNNGNSLWFKKLLRLIAERFATKTELNTKAGKTDLISKNSSFELNNFGNRWVRLAIFNPSLRGATTINVQTIGSGGHLSVYKLTYFQGVGYPNGNLIIEGVGETNYYAVKKFRVVRKGGLSVYLDAYIEPIKTATTFTFYLGVSNELYITQGIDKITLLEEDVEATIPDGYVVKEYVLNNTNNGWIQANLHGNADTATNATKATQDGSGNNIVNTYATKEALGSVNQSIAGLTTGVNTKLEKDASNATTTTTNNIIDKAANGGTSISSLDAEKTNIITKKDGENVKKFSLGTIIAWLIDYFAKQKVHLTLGNILVYQGSNNARSVAPQDYVDEKDSVLQGQIDTLKTDVSKKANATQLNSLGTRVETLEDKVNTTQTRTPGRAIRQTCILEASSSASIDTIRRNYNTTIYPYDICVIINVGSSNITISGFQTSSGANDSYTISPYRMVMFTALGQNSMYVKHNE